MDVSDAETAARENLSRALETAIRPGDIDLELDMAESYGLTSLSKVVFLMSVCEETGVGLASFTESDVAGMRTLRDVVVALTDHTEAWSE